MTIKRLQRERRKRRTRASVEGTAHMPRLAVFRSNKHLYLQLIDDQLGKILASVSDLQVKSARQARLPASPKLQRGETSRQVGALLAQKALKLGIMKVVFDRSGYKYHGNVKAVAEGAREAGLQL